MTTLYTIGYEGTDIRTFVATVAAAGVKVLADVRAVAISRKKGFSKNALRQALSEAGILYQHFIDLGDPKEGRLAARAGRFDDFRKIFGAHLESERAKLALTELAVVVANSATCLMCFERDPTHCHRSIVAARLAKNGILVFDLYGDSPSRYVHLGKHLSGSHSHQGGAARQ